MTRIPCLRITCAVLVLFLLASCAGFKLGADGFGFELAATRIQSEIDKRGDSLSNRRRAIWPRCACATRASSCFQTRTPSA